ncbi:glycosyltransferase family 2 protein [Knoellia subterranea]|uniref:glycosyltransferase family 2 protein n=1 Tax=Knoellia subterranea TaxID=184882 RepID=UPI0012ECA636|nr:glycosyltransferase [Knoellia subterranea]
MPVTGPDSTHRSPTLWGLAVTFQRPEVLRSTLACILDQTRPPTNLVIVDNGSDHAVQSIADAVSAVYLDARTNIGPAGGFALGLQHIVQQAGTDDWVLLIDDDDPPRTSTVLRDLWDLGQELYRQDPSVAGVGVGGSTYKPWSGTFRRLEDKDLSGVVDLDVLFGGSQPMYRVGALRTVPGFDTEFFWGFEEASLGLQLRSHGYRLCADGGAMLDARTASGALGLRSRTIKTARDKAAWRRYYSVRNSTALARRYGGPLAPLVTSLGGAVKGSYSLIRSGAPKADAILPWRGAIDGLNLRLGMRVDPGNNSKNT